MNLKNKKITIPTIACINDLSGFGRCSLTIALPILSVIKCQPCPAPTAILSKHTGYDSYYFHDMEDKLPKLLSDWNSLNFDTIYTGFFGSADQVKSTLDFIKKHPSAIKIIDPAMADSGKLYETCTQELAEQMKKLVSIADIATPNVTEACILSDTPYHGDDMTTDEAKAIAQKIMASGTKAVIITGITSNHNVINFIATESGYLSVESNKTPGYFPGTGDLFSTLITGYITRGIPLEQAVKKASDFISFVTNYTKDNAEIANGVIFEPFLSYLIEEDL